MSVPAAHPGLAAGRWRTLSFCAQLAHVGGEVERALNWRGRRPDLSRRCGERALELLDLTLAAGGGFPRRRELARLREALVDFFFGDNAYGSTPASWRRYFGAFARAARRGAAARSA